MASTDNSLSTASSSIKCASCGTHSRDLNELEIHITVDHLDWVPFHCFYCQFVRLPTEYTLRMHLKEQHPDRDAMLVYKVNDGKREQLLNLVAQSMPSVTQRDRLGRIQNECDVVRPATSSTWSAVSERTVDLSPSPPPVKTGLMDISRIFAQHVSEQDEAAKESSSERPSRMSDRAQNDSPTPLRPPLPENHLALPTRGNNEACSMCGQYFTSKRDEQMNHVASKHMDKNQLCCTLCSYKNNCYQNAYSHAQYAHEIKQNRLSIFTDLRRQYLKQTLDMMKRCFPNTVAPYSDSKRLGKRNRSQSRLSLPPSSAKKSSVKASDTPPSHSKGTRCVMCSTVIRGGNVHNFEQHVVAFHFSEKLFRCRQCDFATSRKQRLTPHVENTGHDVEDCQLELRDALQSVTRQCFPTLRN